MCWDGLLCIAGAQHLVCILSFDARLTFVVQVMPMYVAEVAPPHLRGGLSSMFEWAIVFGELCGGLITYSCDFTGNWGWRLPLGLGAVPGVIVFLGGIVLPESPISLIERGDFEKAREVSLCSVSSVLFYLFESNQLLQHCNLIQSPSRLLWLSQSSFG